MLSCNTCKCLYISCVSFLSVSHCHHGTALFAILCSLSPCAEAVAAQRDQNLCRAPTSPCLEGPGLFSAVSVGAQQVQCAPAQDPSRLEAPTPPLQQHKRHILRDLQSGKQVGFVGRVLISTGTESAANYILDDFPVTAILKSAFSAN